MQCTADDTQTGFRSIGALARAEVARQVAPDPDDRLEALVLQLAAVLSVVTPHDLSAVQDVLCAWLDSASPGGPYACLGDARHEAAFWADMAPPHEIEAYTAAGLRAIERRNFGEVARKRILVAMWESLPDKDRIAFLRQVDPKGRFRGK